MDLPNTLIMFAIFMPMMIVAYMTVRRSAQHQSTYPQLSSLLLDSGFLVLGATIVILVTLTSGNDRAYQEGRFMGYMLWSILMAAGILNLSRAVNTDRQPSKPRTDDDDSSGNEHG